MAAGKMCPDSGNCREYLAAHTFVQAMIDEVSLSKLWPNGPVGVQQQLTNCIWAIRRKSIISRVQVNTHFYIIITAQEHLFSTLNDNCSRLTAIFAYCTQQIIARI